MKRTKPTYHSFFYFVLGVILSTAFILYFTGPNGNIETKDYLNLLGGFLMFLVACIAAWINFKHLEWQKQSRIWEINKDKLFELLNLADKSIKFYEVAINCCKNKEKGISNKSIPEVPLAEAIGELNSLLANFKRNFDTILPQEVMNSIEDYTNNCQKVFDDKNACSIDSMKAIELLHESSMQLKKSIKDIMYKFILLQ